MGHHSRPLLLSWQRFRFPSRALHWSTSIVAILISAGDRTTRLVLSYRGLIINSEPSVRVMSKLMAADGSISFAAGLTVIITVSGSLAPGGGGARSATSVDRNGSMVTECTCERGKAVATGEAVSVAASWEVLSSTESPTMTPHCTSCLYFASVRDRMPIVT